MTTSRNGRPKTIDDTAIIASTLDPPPERLGLTHWSRRAVPRQLGVGDATVARAWRRYHGQSWRRATFKLSTDPDLMAKVRGVSGCTSTARAGHREVRRREEPGPGARPDGTDRVRLHWTQTSRSRLSLVEVFFGIITRQAIRRGSFHQRPGPRDRDPHLHVRLERALPTRSSGPGQPTRSCRTPANGTQTRDTRVAVVQRLTYALLGIDHGRRLWWGDRWVTVGFRPMW